MPNDSPDQRFDALHGTPVIVAGSRQDRPNLPATDCPFCVGGLEAPEPYVVKSFANRWPTLGSGRSEVVLYSPDHDQALGSLSLAAVRQVIDLWSDRTAQLGAREDVAYVLVFENRGKQVGATINHPHGQIYAYNDIPPVPLAELRLASERGSCALCDDVEPDLVVVRHDSWISWVPFASGHPYGLTIAPQSHLPDLVGLDDAQRNAFAQVLSESLRRLDCYFQEDSPYMLWIHQQPTDGNEWPHSHVHAEIVPFRRAPGVSRFIAAAELGGGTLINSVDPLDAARNLREVTLAPND